MNEASRDECAGFSDLALASDPRTVHATTAVGIGNYGCEHFDQWGRLLSTVAFPSDLRELSDLGSQKR